MEHFFPKGIARDCWHHRADLEDEKEPFGGGATGGRHLSVDVVVISSSSLSAVLFSRRVALVFSCQA